MRGFFVCYNVVMKVRTVIVDALLIISILAELFFGLMMAMVLIEPAEYGIAVIVAMPMLVFNLIILLALTLIRVKMGKKGS